MSFVVWGSVFFVIDALLIFVPLLSFTSLLYLRSRESRQKTGTLLSQWNSTAF